MLPVLKAIIDDLDAQIVPLEAHIAECNELGDDTTIRILKSGLQDRLIGFLTAKVIVLKRAKEFKCYEP